MNNGTELTVNSDGCEGGDGGGRGGFDSGSGGGARNDDIDRMPHRIAGLCFCLLILFAGIFSLKEFIAVAERNWIGVPGTVVDQPPLVLWMFTQWIYISFLRRRVLFPHVIEYFADGTAYNFRAINATTRHPYQVLERQSKFFTIPDNPGEGEVDQKIPTPLMLLLAFVIASNTLICCCSILSVFYRQ